MEITYFLSFNRLVSKPFYRMQTRMFATDDMVFLNIGYEEDPPMALPLTESDEPNRFYIQLYHRTAAQADLGGKQVLEVGCGHGGGASYATTTSAVGEARCDVNHHPVAGRRPGRSPQRERHVMPSAQAMCPSKPSDSAISR